MFIHVAHALLRVIPIDYSQTKGLDHGYSSTPWSRLSTNSRPRYSKYGVFLVRQIDSSQLNWRFGLCFKTTVTLDWDIVQFYLLFYVVVWVRAFAWAVAEPNRRGGSKRKISGLVLEKRSSFFFSPKYCLVQNVVVYLTFKESSLSIRVFASIPKLCVLPGAGSGARALHGTPATGLVTPAIFRRWHFALGRSSSSYYAIFLKDLQKTRTSRSPRSRKF